MINKSYTHLSWGIAVAAFLAGIFSTVAVTAGDGSGRVNLMYLVLLYVVFPLLSLLMFAVFSALKKPPLVVGTLSQLSLWPSAWRDALPELKREQRFQPWLFCQSQKAMLSFNLGCVGAFITLLLFNDLSFVWRSTVLDAEDIYPFLAFIAAPWAFIDSAQPALDLLVTTRDSRLAANPTAGAEYGLWWKFLVAAQLCYGILPRLALLWLANHRFNAQLNRSVEMATPVSAPLINRPPETPALAQVVKDSAVPEQYCQILWADLPEALLAQVTEQIGQPEQTFRAGPQGDITQELAAESDSRVKLVLVAAWEPPLGELLDFLQQGQGYLMPLDWRNDRFQPVSALHLDEWRRFCYPLEQWQLLQLDDASIDEESP